MGTFSSFLWGGAGGSSGGTAGVPLSTLLNAMLRIAGITTLPGTTPNVDQYGELIPMVNRMLSGWNCDGHKIFTTKIEDFPLVADQKVYTIGPGGDFDTERPISIKLADIIFPTNPELRRPIRILSDYEWSIVGIQDITGAPPLAIYYDGSMDENGLAKIYVYFQPPDGYSLEIYTWQQLANSFESPTDVAVFPPGYEEAIVWNGGIKIAGMYPLEAKVAANAMTFARDSLNTLIALNSKNPQMRSEAAGLNNRANKRSSMTPWGWWIGP